MLLLIDNYDSFTYNIYHYLREVGADVDVRRNDALTPQEAFDLKPEGIVLSPGPCGPDNSGICLELTRLAAQKIMPLLGVCLGHQAIGQAFGGKIIRAPAPVHGKTDVITHGDDELFAGIASPFSVMRYHSLIVERESLPGDLAVTAENRERIIMGLRHKTKPIYGVQFHPESIASEHGHALLKNFYEIARDQASLSSHSAF